MAPDTMRAAYVTRLGPASEIHVGSLPVPTPGPTDVLVEVEAVAVNPVDTYVRSGGYRTPVPLPFVIGRDLVGTVAEAGPGTGFEPGERVWSNSLGHDGRQGPSSQYAVVPSGRLYRLPRGVDPHVAVALAQPAATAYLGWFVHARLRPGRTVFVGGGGGNVGTAAIQMAAWAGARVLTSARPEDHERCRAAGAEVALDYRDRELAARLAAHAPGGLDVVWETSGHHDFALAAAVAAPGCRILVTAALPAEPAVPLRTLYTHDVSLVGFVISRASAADLAAAADLVNQMMVEGRLTTRIADRLRLEDAAAAHRRMEAGSVPGRLVVDVAEDPGSPALPTRSGRSGPQANRGGEVTR
jgi:NADPH:quinone reductase-like Zn-dependent oxidoreductase